MKITSLALVILAGNMVASAQSAASRLPQIKSGHIVSVIALDRPAMSVNEAVVNNGKIEAPLIGSVQVEGMAIPEVCRTVAERLMERVPQVADAKIICNVRLF